MLGVFPGLIIYSRDSETAKKNNTPNFRTQFGIYEFIRTEFMNRKMGEHKPRAWIPPAIRRKFGIGEVGVQQPEYVKEFLKNVFLLEEELV